MQHVGVVPYGLYMYRRDQNVLLVDESGKPRFTPGFKSRSIPIPSLRSNIRFVPSRPSWSRPTPSTGRQSAVDTFRVNTALFKPSRLLDFDIAKGANPPCSHFLSQLLII
jgi:hypothetical protein